MTCEETSVRAFERLQGTLDQQLAHELERHVASCAACRNEVAATERVWHGMGALDDEVPSTRMRARFHAALDAWTERERRGLGSRLAEAFERLWPRQPALQGAIALAALVLGMFVGGRLESARSSELQALRTEMQGELRAVQNTVSLALLEHQSASERLRGVEWARNAEPDPRAVEALLDRVRTDPSVNVRLAAVQALAPLAAEPEVGSELLAALERQESAVMRVSLAELLLDARVAGAERAVGELLEAQPLDPAVEEHLRALLQARTS